MSKVVIIGAGGVGNVVAQKCAQLVDVFTEIVLASRTVTKCEAIAADVKAKQNITIRTAALDADDVAATTEFLQAEQPELLINVALPYQDLTNGCMPSSGRSLRRYRNYDRTKKPNLIQMAMGLPRQLQEAGLTALLGSGFDPGVTMSLRCTSCTMRSIQSIS